MNVRNGSSSIWAIAVWMALCATARVDRGGLWFHASVAAASPQHGVPWTSAVGLGAHGVHGSWGAGVTWQRYGVTTDTLSLDAVRRWRLGSAMGGVTAGPLLGFWVDQRPRLGVAATAWLQVGVTPFVRTTWVDGEWVVQLGLGIGLPIVRWGGA